VVKVHSNLILPDKYVEEHKISMVDEFKKSLEKVVNENQYRDKPYFVSYHENDDKVKQGLIRGKWTASYDLPMRWARQVVFVVDNKKGFKEWIWTVDDDRKTFFNTDGIKNAKAKGALSKTN